MKKTVKVSLGGFAYDVEEDAFQLLDSYINALKSRLNNEKESQEIIQDIEERISELFAEKKGSSEAISIEIVNEIIQILGKPEEIVSESDASYHRNNTYIRNRRLYRNPDHSYIAGVCSGLGEYFGTDPIVFRIIFLVLLFAKGFGLILYIVLWIVVPKAITPKQKLEMKGEPFNISNIEKSIKEEYSNVNKSINKTGLGGFIEKLVNLIGRLAYWFIQFLLILIKIIAAIIAIVLIVTMLIALFVLISVLFFGGMLFNTAFPEIHGIPLSEVITSMFDFSSGIWLTIPIFLIIAIPIFVILYIGIRILFRFRARDGLLGLIAAGVWIASIVILAITLFYQVKSFTIRKNVTETVAISPQLPKGGTLYIKSKDQPDSAYYFHSNVVELDEYRLTKVNGRTYITGKPSLTIEKGGNEKPELIFVRKARGGTALSAEMTAKSIKYNYVLNDSVLNLDSYFTVPSGEKWKLQELSITLKIPEDYKIFIDSSVEDILNPHQPLSDYWPNEMVDKKWTLKEKMLKELEK